MRPSHHAPHLPKTELLTKIFSLILVLALNHNSYTTGT
uniref:Uncharacterized protein n=1 Tax=Arundo donax TaxID=35708 RepID=A0A0A9AKP4_ARUDO